MEPRAIRPAPLRPSLVATHYATPLRDHTASFISILGHMDTCGGRGRSAVIEREYTCAIPPHYFSVFSVTHSFELIT
ncbi:unnamed protein product [Colias eurytheme]|nr:unnamed protein product [Colias eurytheme]